jgi:hypothetical protein
MTVQHERKLTPSFDACARASFAPSLTPVERLSDRCLE